MKTKGALCFALHTGVEYLDADTTVAATPGTPGKGKGVGKGVPALVTRLAVGCRRKIVLYSWKDGEPQDVQVRQLVAHGAHNLKDEVLYVGSWRTRAFPEGNHVRGWRDAMLGTHSDRLLLDICEDFDHC